MSINLNKHRDSLSGAWKDVLDDKTDTDWALFGYEGQTNDLKVVSKGSGGIEELIDDLNSGKIMYAFVKVNDPKTSLPKCVLIIWQGEGANTVRKGLCANHLRDVENFFKGAHLTINARNEEEVEPQLILDKVSKSGSAYSFKAPRGDTSGPTGPIGSNYKRVNPIKEINAKERDQFWLKEEQEEKKRIEGEHRRKEEESKKREDELRKREFTETTEREAKDVLRNNKIAQIKEAETMAYELEKKQESEVYREENEVKVNQSDLLRQQRKREAEDIISQRTIDARSIFEKNTAAGQMKRTPEKPIRNSILKAQGQGQNVVENKETVSVPQNVYSISPQNQEIPNKLIEDQSDDEGDQFSTIKRSPRDVEKKVESSPTTETQNENKNSVKQDNKILYKTAQPITEQQFVDEVIYQDFSEGPGLQARALYDYQAADETEITFDPGDMITNIDQVDEGWWQGLAPDGSYGLFPANYVELIH